MTARLYKTLLPLAALVMLPATFGLAQSSEEQPPWQQTRAPNEQNGSAYRRPKPQRQYMKSAAASKATTQSVGRVTYDNWKQQPLQKTNSQSSVQRTNWQQPSGGNAGPPPMYNSGPGDGYSAGESYVSEEGGSGDAYTPYDNYGPGDGSGYDFGPNSVGGPEYGGDCDSCGTCGPCGGCGPGRGAVYARAEYLAWWMTGESLPPLVTTSPSGTAPAQAGVLNQSGTSILYGNDAVNTNARSGGRVAIGWWISPTTRVEGEWFGLGTINSNFSQSSDGSTILARPFYNLNTSAQDSLLVAAPGLRTGTINVSNTSNFLGAGVHLTKNILYNSNYCDRSHRLDFLYGFRYLGLYENMGVNSTSNIIQSGGLIPQGSVIGVSDSFKTSNSFYGATLGMSSEARANRWTFSGVGRLGFGGTNERVTINGQTSDTAPGGLSKNVTSGGLLAMPTNIGTYSHSVFSLVPQMELKIGYNLSPAWRVTIGYDVIYWSRVVRPAQQADLYVNPTQGNNGTLKGTPGPLFKFQETDLWVQGISTGLECRF
ncbi:MAG TPA: BBP7 family outer membrane beta-barrel protein [Pirellulales bacterium]|jgi:hypothetical protein